MRIEGFAKIDRHLARLSRVSQRKVIEAALRAGGQILIDEAKLQVPVATGTLRDSITMRFGGRSSGAGQHFRSRDLVVGPRRRTAFYGSMVEFGTEDTAPEPYMRPAFEIAAPAAVRAAVDHLAGAWRAAEKG